MNTTFLKKEDAQARRQWYVADAAGIPLGRLATRVARVLMGKHRPTYTPHVDGGDFVVVINAGRMVLTGNKLEQKMNYRHSGYPGGQHFTPYKVMVSQYPERTFQLAVKGMLPKTRLGKRMIKKLKVFRGAAHPYGGSRPEVLS